MNRTAIKTEAEEFSEAALEARAVVIARDNDTFRRHMGCAQTIAGRTLFTIGVRQLGDANVTRAFCAVRDFADFTEDNDPHGERNFGAFDIDDHRLFWKIDYYADASCTWGSEDPTDPEQVYRVLTVMLASEY